MRLLGPCCISGLFGSGRCFALPTYAIIDVALPKFLIEPDLSNLDSY